MPDSGNSWQQLLYARVGFEAYDSNPSGGLMKRKFRLQRQWTQRDF
jgi:hypothetical protein